MLLNEENQNNRWWQRITNVVKECIKKIVEQKVLTAKDEKWKAGQIGGNVNLGAANK